jgi:hypothetical protein
MTAAERQVLTTAKRLRGPMAEMMPSDRLHVMHRLLNQVEQGERWSGGPDTTTLERLAAHCIVWAEQRDDPS